MAADKEGFEKITVGKLQDISGEVNIAGGDIYKGYSAEQVSLLLEQLTEKYQRKPFDGRCPYKGLDAFEEQDAEFFFGREKLIEDLTVRISKARTLFITGPSGSGKSSIVRAGLLPALKRGSLEGWHSDQWLYTTIRPGRDPLEALALGFSRLKSPELADYFREHAGEDTVLNECAESVLSDQPNQRLVLFLDQFEEVFTQVGKEKAARFLSMLACAGTAENGRVLLIFAMRSDFISNCAAYPELNKLLNQQFIQIGAMQPDELVSAIAQPALRVGLPIDPQLIAQIISDMKGEAGTLPLMQFALKDLFDSEQAGHGVSGLTLETYVQRGGIHKALERHADDVFSGLTETEQALSRTVFSGLIEVGRGTQDTRRTALVDELVPAAASKADVESIIGKLASARLITTDEQGGRDIVMLSHERLIDAWPWLKKLVDDNREAIALQNEIASDAREWNEHGRDISYLYTGARLARVREQAGAKRLMLSGLANDLVQASRARQQRGVRLIIAAVSAVVLLSIMAAAVFASQARQNQQTAETAQAANTFAVAQQETALAASTFAVAQQGTAVSEANISLARLLAAEAQQAQAEDGADTEQLHALLAIESLRRFPTIEADQALRGLGDFWMKPARGDMSDDIAPRSAISPDGKWIAIYDSAGIHIRDAASGAPASSIAIDSSLSWMQFSPDGKWIAAWGGGAGVWDAQTGLQSVHVSPDAFVADVAFSPNGGHVGYETDDGTVSVVDTATGRTIANVKVGSSIRDALFSPDLKWIAWTADDGVIKIWDLATASQIADLANQESSSLAAFSPDGKRLVSKAQGQDAFVQLWDTTTWRPIKSQSIDAQQLSVWVRPSTLFSPDSQRIVSQISDNTLLEWDAATGDEIATLQHDLGLGLETVAISPDGNWLAAADFAGTVHVWDLAGHAERSRVSVPGITGGIGSVAFSPDGKWITTIGDSIANAQTWLWRTKDLIQSACQNYLTRNLYLREWQQYVGALPYGRTCDNLVPLPEATSTLSGYMTAEAQNRATLAAMTTPTP